MTNARRICQAVADAGIGVREAVVFFACDGRTPKEIEDQCNMCGAHVRSKLRQLLLKGLVTRNDGAPNRYGLTETGRALSIRCSYLTNKRGL